MERPTRRQVLAEPIALERVVAVGGSFQRSTAVWMSWSAVMSGGRITSATRVESWVLRTRLIPSSFMKCLLSLDP
jgi:hypothetical protein